MKRSTKIVLISTGALVLISASAFFGVRACLQHYAADLFAAVMSADSKPTWRQHLPATAAEINESSVVDGFLPDYSYQLKARLSEPEFQQFIARLGLTLHTSIRHYSQPPEPWLAWGSAHEPWWDPSPSLERTYVDQSGDTWTAAKYENGYLYFFSLNH